MEPKLKNLIDCKSKVECSNLALQHSSTYIHQLTDHINNSCKLSSIDINNKIDYLAGCLTITLDFPTQELEFLRARMCEDEKFCYADDLSYIKNTTPTFPKIGRLNLAGSALFYGSVIVKKDDSALRVALSEVGAKELDHLNVLRSYQKAGCDLCLRIIGIWDYVRRDERPYYIGIDVFEYYKEARAYMGKKFSPELLLAYELTDRFFADILSRKGSEALYQVTSTLSSIFMSEHIDGVLYSSVHAKGEPVVALTPAAVDSKLEHRLACHVMVEKCYGYEFYKYKTIAKASITKNTSKLNW
ncbi:MAG: hypothetical protein LBE21_01175 [Pseudomonadales bacterium]|nr:hypothetical protein [Pseudomonadales bacterium]